MVNQLKLLPIVNYAVELNQIKQFLEKRVYTYNPELAEMWMKSPNPDFEGMTPSEVIVKNGMAGIKRIREYLSYRGGQDE